MVRDSNPWSPAYQANPYAKPCRLVTLRPICSSQFRGLTPLSRNHPKLIGSKLSRLNCMAALGAALLPAPPARPLGSDHANSSPLRADMARANRTEMMSSGLS